MVAGSEMLAHLERLADSGTVVIHCFGSLEQE